MKIFISWSGEVSKQIAEALREWLPQVIQSIEPWMSSSDIEKGARWGNDIGSNLETTNFGIVCLTPDNLIAPWILFEAGALSKSLESSKVCPVLFDLEPTDIEGPLVQFQASKLNKLDIYELLKSIGSAMGAGRLEDSVVEKSLEKWWPDLEEKIESISKKKTSTKKERTQKEYLKEILSVVRETHKNEISTRSSNQLKEAANEMLLGLSLTEQSLLREEFGVGDKEQYSAFIASAGLSPEDKRLIIEKALRKLRHPSKSEKLQEFLRLNSNDEERNV